MVCATCYRRFTELKTRIWLDQRLMRTKIMDLNVWFVFVSHGTRWYCPVVICAYAIAALTRFAIKLTTAQSVELHSELCFKFELFTSPTHQSSTLTHKIVLKTFQSDSFLFRLSRRSMVLATSETASTARTQFKRWKCSTKITTWKWVQLLLLRETPRRRSTDRLNSSECRCCYQTKRILIYWTKDHRL